MILGGVLFLYGTVRSVRKTPPDAPRSRVPHVTRRPLPVVDYRHTERQLRIVESASFRGTPLLNRSELRIFKIIEDLMAKSQPGYRVFAQASLGEILASPNKDAFLSINSRRVDILIVDPDGWPIAAVEYQGGGHYQGDAVNRDAIKKTALRKAGIPYVEVFPEDDVDQIYMRIGRQLGWKTAARAEASAGRDHLGKVADGPWSAERGGGPRGRAGAEKMDIPLP
jgi:Protein of unknown function (DUF2726)